MTYLGVATGSVCYRYCWGAGNEVTWCVFIVTGSIAGLVSLIQPPVAPGLATSVWIDSPMQMVHYIFMRWVCAGNSAQPADWPTVLNDIGIFTRDFEMVDLEITIENVLNKHNIGFTLKDEQVLCISNVLGRKHTLTP